MFLDKKPLVGTWWDCKFSELKSFYESHLEEFFYSKGFINCYHQKINNYNTTIFGRRTDSTDQFFFFSGLSFKEHKIYDPNGYLLHFFSFFLITNESFSIKENNRINIEIVVANYHITQKNFHTLSPFVLCPEMSNNTFIIDVIDDYFHKNFSYFSEFIKNILVELSKPKYKMTVITNLSSLPTVKSYEKKRMKRENDLKWFNRINYDKKHSHEYSLNSLSWDDSNVFSIDWIDYPKNFNINLFLDLQFMNNKILPEEEIQILDLYFTYHIACSLYDEDMTRSQHEIEYKHRFFYKYMNKHLFSYWSYLDDQQTVYSGGICILDLQKEVLTYKKKRYIFYRLLSIASDDIHYYLSKEILLKKYYLVNCTVDSLIIFPDFSFLKHLMTLKEYNKVTSLMKNSKFSKISKNDVEKVLCEFLRLHKIEKTIEEHQFKVN